MPAVDDMELVREFVRNRSEACFAELVRRHVNLVYSVALHCTGNGEDAKDVAQEVFVVLARKAARLREGTILSGWLYETTRYTAARFRRTDHRRHAREQEAYMQSISSEPDSDQVWRQLSPFLEAGMSGLKETDRAVLVLRYYEKRSGMEVASLLGISEAAAHKRLERAVAKLREFFARKGVTLSATAIAGAVSAHSVQAAPAGLAGSIAATAFSATTAGTAAVIAATKGIVMSTLQKTFVTTVLVAAVGAGIFEAHQNAQLQQEKRALQDQQAPLADLARQLLRGRDEATNQLAALLAESQQMKATSDSTELLSLRSEVSRLRSGRQPAVENTNDQFMQEVSALSARASELNAHLQQMPEKRIPELQFLTPTDWLTAAQIAQFDTDAHVRQALAHLRSLAKQKTGLGGALHNFADANDGQLPTEISQLKPFLKSSADGAPIDDATKDAILARYALLRTGNLKALAPGAWIVGEKAPVDKEYDSRAKYGLGTSTVIGTGLGSAGDPEDPNY